MVLIGLKTAVLIAWCYGFWLVVKEQFWLDEAGLSPVVQGLNQEQLYNSGLIQFKGVGTEPDVKSSVRDSCQCTEYMTSLESLWPLDFHYL